VGVSERAINSGTEDKIIFRQTLQCLVSEGLGPWQIVLIAGHKAADRGDSCQEPARILACYRPQALLSLVQAAGTGVKPAGKEEKESLGEAKRRVVGVPPLREQFEPTSHDRQLTAEQLYGDVAF